LRNLLARGIGANTENQGEEKKSGEGERPRKEGEKWKEVKVLKNPKY